jgi:hypothetical protein
MITSSKKLTDDVWFAGGVWTWNGFMPHISYSKYRNSLAIPACIDGGVKNAVFTMWGDNGGECPYFSALGMLMHAVAQAEGLSEEETRERFRLITGEDYDAFMSLELPDFIYGESTTVGSANYSKNRLYDDHFLAIVSRNSGDVDTSVFARYAKMMYEQAETSKSFPYLFKTAAALCECLEIKFDLPTRTRALYADGDKEGLRRLAETDYTEFLARLEKFYAVFREQWYAVNKTYGFEVQEQRIGGLMLRTRSCISRLTDYADGKIDSIAELEEPVLPMAYGNLPYNISLSACIL